VFSAFLLKKMGYGKFKAAKGNLFSVLAVSKTKVLESPFWLYYFYFYKKTCFFS
jgi:hypothetical protein